MPSKKFSIVVNETCSKPLERLARALGFVRGTTPSVAAMVEALAAGKLTLEKTQATNALSPSQIELMVKLWKRLQDNGEITDSEELAQVIIDAPMISEEFRQSIMDKLSQPPIWVDLIKGFISRQESFQIAYSDATGKLWSFTICYAEILYRKGKYYLECWASETEGNLDIPELQHNWSLRLDRIKEAAIVPTKERWHNGLDEIDVVFDLLGSLAHGYEPLDDISAVWIATDRKRITRRVNNTFWLARSLLPYGANCIVLSPPLLREKFKDIFSSGLNNYNNEGVWGSYNTPAKSDIMAGDT